MKKVALVIANKNFRDEEYLDPKTILKKNSIDVVTVSSKKGFCTGKLGARVTAEMDINEALNSDFDGVFFIGGPGASEFFKDPLSHELLKKSLDNGKIIGAICIAPTTLAYAGLLKGKRATAHPDAESALNENGAIWTGADVEVDGNIITANGPHAAKSFGDAIVKSLGNKSS